MWVGDDIAKIFIEFRAEIQSSYGVDVKLDTTDVGERLRRKYIAAARQAGDVDVFVGPHDWVGELVAEQAVEPVALSEEQRQKLHEFALHPFRSNGVIYGIPATMDTVMLIRNVELVGDEPTCFEEVVEAGRALQRRGIEREIIAVRVGPEGDPFLIWPLLSSGGAWLFGTDPNGAWDIRQVGIDSPESISAFERIAALGEGGEGIIRREMDQAWIERTFLRGKCPFMLGAYGDVARAHDAGLTVAVSPVPGFRNGRPAKPFTTIYGFYIAPFGRNRIIASDLLPDYLTRFDVMSALSARIESPVARIEATAQTDSPTKELVSGRNKPMLMPSFAQMPAVWGHLARAEVEVIAGADPGVSARKAAAAIRRIVS
jgi:arabinogalactan oligomer/maltooligosaccharide transport system substrate-binding protein